MVWLCSLIPGAEATRALVWQSHHFVAKGVLQDLHVFKVCREAACYYNAEMVVTNGVLVAGC